MGLAFEELIRKFAELSNETAGSTSRRAKSSG
jgi:type I restriction-modification system DNA methylase subunit